MYGLKYIIYADKAWTQSQPLYRYHFFLVEYYLQRKNLTDFEAEVILLKKDHNYKKEIKWSNISRQHIKFYESLLFLIEKIIRASKKTKYRQMFMDSSYRYIGESASEPDSHFKIYYQVLKHSFVFVYINEKIFTFKLDTHSNHGHKLKLKTFIEGLEIHNVDIRVKFINSKKSIPIQVCDLLMGAAGYYGNKADWDLLH